VSEVNGFWNHVVTEINEEERTGICSQCGPVPIRNRAQVGDKVYWRCGRFDATRYRRRIRNEVTYRYYLKPACERCSFVAIDRVQLDIHHRDGDHSNDDPENLETLCANCHRLEHVTAIVATEVWT
jgi:5-methylcytosine-specific restriction endonuclease McrA